MAVIAGVDVGNATTEVAVIADGRLLGVDRLPTRGRKGSAESLRGAAALVRRIERRIGRTVELARVAPLRAVDTSTLAIPASPPPTGRLRTLAVGVSTPGCVGACVGVPLRLDRPLPPELATTVAAVVPAGMRYTDAVRRLRDLLAAAVPVGAVLVAGDEGVLIANRLDARMPVIDQVDVERLEGCTMVAAEVRAPGQPLTLLCDPVALAAAFSLESAERADAATLCRALVDYSNAVVGRADQVPASAISFIPAPAAAAAQPSEPWVGIAAERLPLRSACARVAGWPVGTVRSLGSTDGETDVDDLFALDLAAVADAAVARRGSLGRSALVASLQRLATADHAGPLAQLLDRPVECLLTEPAAARKGALTTPGSSGDAVVVDLGAGTIDVIAPGGEVVAAGAGELLTTAVAETLGIPRAAADWIKRGPCVRVDTGQRFEAEDGTRGFLDRPAPASATGLLAVPGPAGLLPFGRGHSPAEWRAIRLQLKQAVFAVNLRRALDTLGAQLRQVLIVGGPAGDDELLGVLLRALPPDVPVGRANVGGTLQGPSAGHRYAAALGLALLPAIALAGKRANGSATHVVSLSFSRAVRTQRQRGRLPRRRHPGRRPRR